MGIPVSDHAINRFLDRMVCIPVTQADVYRALQNVSEDKLPIPKPGESVVIWVFVKKLSMVFHAEGSSGDVVWAVVRRTGPRDPGAVTTICLRKSSQKPQHPAVIIW